MSHNILIIDDEEAVRNSFVLALEEGDYNIDLAASGQEGVEKVKSKKYDLIFLDLKMPGWNGVETFRKIRQLDIDVEIYFITAFHRDYLDELKSLHNDEMNYELLKKPLGLDAISSLIKGILGEYK